MNNSKTAVAFDRLQGIMALLRSPEGCPWDAAQTPESLRRYLLEETYEVLEAIDTGEPGAIRDELGDLLLQVVFQARIFEERGEFDLGDVASAIADKLERRHPHVFGGSAERDMAILDLQWERIKAEEKQERGKPESPSDEIPVGLPALARARKVAEKMGRKEDRTRDARETVEQLEQDLLRFRSALLRDAPRETEESLGQLLFSIARIAAEAQIDAEEALRQAINTALAAHEHTRLP